MRIQEHRSREAKKAAATPLMNHIATPSSFPHPGEAWVDEVRALGSSEAGRRLNKLVQVVEVVAAMNWRYKLPPHKRREV